MDKQPYKRMEFEDRDDNKNFYDQFDRESPLFHGGDKTPVPYGEGLQKLPESMPTEHPKDFNSEEAIKPDPHNLDPVIINLSTAMAGFRDYKKHWSKVADTLVIRG